VASHARVRVGGIDVVAISIRQQCTDPAIPEHFGIDLGALLGGAIITEYTFGLPGIGRLAVESVFFSDLPLLLGVMLFSATMILLCNIVVDATYAFIDPRVRLA